MLWTIFSNNVSSSFVQAFGPFLRLDADEAVDEIGEGPFIAGDGVSLAAFLADAKSPCLTPKGS